MKARSSLRNRTVLLTGAAGGIGRALARQLAVGEGARLVLVDRDGKGLSRLRAELEAAGAQTTTYECDLRSRGAVEALGEAVRQSPLDVLVNNAGVAFGASFEETTVEEIDAALEVNLVALMHLTRLLLPQLLASPRGFIVNVASAGGLVGAGGMAAYAASKFGVVGFSESLRAELRHRGVGVSAICPAFVRTDIVRNSAASLTGRAGGAEVESLSSLVWRLGVSPETVARAASRAIQRDEGVVVVGAVPRLLVLAHALFPELSARLNHALYIRLRAGRWVR
jgi:short-subunit dehydrogenase